MNGPTLIRVAAVAALLSSASAFGGATISTATTSLKVKPRDAAPPEMAASFLAARNEFVSFQIVVRADAAGATNVAASAGDLTGPGTIRAGNVQLYRAEYLNLTKMSFPQATAGRYPDPLVPDVDETAGEKRNAFPFSIPAHESRVIWVDVLVPQDAPAGLYQGQVHITGAGIDQQVPVSINVLNTALPSTSSLATAFLFHRNVACSAHTGNSECGDAAGMHALAAKYQKLALEHRITLSNTVSFPSNGDWATFDQRYAPWLNGTAPSRLPGARMTSVQYPGKREAAPLKAFEAHFAQRGWLDRAYDYTGDEPPYGISFSEAKARAQLVKSAAPGLRTLLTTTIQASDEHGLSPYLDLITPVINFMDGTEVPYVGDQRAAYDPFLTEPGNALWVYQSCMSHGCAFGTTAPENNNGTGWPSYMVDASGAKNRAMQWLMFLQNASGELYYETALALDTAWTDIFRFNGNGDGTLFYPGLPSKIGGTTHVPVPSIRLKLIRQGMQDYEWLKKVADAGDPGFAQQVARKLLPAAHKVTDDGAAFDAARTQLISRWLELQPKGTQPPTHTPPGDGHQLHPPEQPVEGAEPETPVSAPPPTKTGVIIGRLGCSAGGGAFAGGFAILGLALALLRRR